MGSKRQPKRNLRKESRNRTRRTRHTVRPSRGDSRFEQLEDRQLLAVDFVPLPLGSVATNRVDQALGLVNPSTQPAIALDTHDPGVIAIANESELIVSANAGNTFAPAGSFADLLNDRFVASGVSDLVYTADGELKWSSLRTSLTGEQNIGVATNQSSLSVIPWEAEAIARPSIAADTNPASDSAYSGRLYVAFTDETTNEVLLSHSEDGRTWARPVRVSDPAETVPGNLPPVTPAGISVGSNGDVYVAYHYQSGSTTIEGPDDLSNADGVSGQIFVRRSIDGGATFVSKTNAFLPGEADVSLNVQTVAGAIPHAQFLNQGGRQPTILADSARPGHVYVIAADDPDNTHGSGDEGDIVFARSTDFGQTWDQRTLSSVGALQTMPQAAIDPFGNLIVAWYDTQLGQLQGLEEDYRLHVFASYSVDGGTEWSTPIQITDTTNPIDQVTPETEVVYPGADLDDDDRVEDDGDETYSLGDYFGVELFGGTAYFAWNGNVRTIGLPSAHQVFFDVLPIFGSLRVTGLDADDTFLVRAMPDNDEYLEVFVNGQREYAGLKESLTGGIHFDGLAGNDTLVVDYEAGGDPVPPGGIFYQGNIPEGGQGVGDTLDILTGGRSVRFENEASDLDAGLFVIGDSPAISFDSVERTKIDATDYVRPDAYESNDSRLTATVLGSEPAITLRDLTIHSQGGSATNPDYYRVTASESGMLIINTLFDHLQGDLELAVFDSRGILAASSDTDTSDERVVIPVAAQETYWIQVAGEVNTYSLEVENFAAPTPQAITLDPTSDSGMMNNDGITADTTLRFSIQADLSSLTSEGIPILDAAAATDSSGPGAAVFVTVRDQLTGAIETGYATPVDDDLFTYTTQELPDGWLVASASVHILDVRQIEAPSIPSLLPDPAIGSSVESNPATIQLDTLQPEITSPQMLPSSDSGMSASDHVTNIMQPAFVGITEPNVKVRILANGLIVGEGVAASDGRWEITIEPLTAGIYAMTSQAEDVAGNFGESDIVRFLEIDKTAPNTPYLDLVAGSDTGLSDTDNVTGDNTLTFTMTTSDTHGEDHLSEFNLKYRLYSRPEGGEEILVYDSSTDATIPAANREDGFTDLGLLTTTLSELPDGVHNFKLEIEDRAGNISHAFLLPVEIDTSLPGPLTIDLLASSDSGMDDTDNVTRFIRPTFGGISQVGATVQLFANDRLVGTGVVAGDASDGQPDDGLGAWEVTSGTLDDGVYQITAITETDAGTSRTEPLTIEVDTLQPNTPLLDLIPSSDTGHSVNDNITNSINPTFNFSTQDPRQDQHLDEFNYKFRLFVRVDSGPEELVYDSVGDTLLPNSATDGVFTNLENLRRSITRGMPDGTHNFKLEVEDRAGNISDDFLLDVTVDTTLLAPNDGLTMDLIQAADSGMDPLDNTTRINTPTFAGIAEVGSEVSLFADGMLVGTSTVGSDETDFNPGDGLGAWQVRSAALVDGIHQMVVHIEDWAGNFAQTEDLTIDVDTTAPNTPYLSVAGGQSVGMGVQVSLSEDLVLTMTSEDPDIERRLLPFNYKFRIYQRSGDGPETLVYDSVADPSIPAERTSDGFTDLTFLQTTLEDLPEGQHNFKLEVEDRAGNISQDYLLSVVRVTPLGLDAVSIDLLSASDTGMNDNDNVTNKDRPGFTGVATVGAEVRLISITNAGEETIGRGIVSGDASNGVLNDGLGVWEITADALDDGAYSIVAEIEDDFGNTARTESIQVEVDTIAPNTPQLDLLPAGDTGISNRDNLTSEVLPTFNMATLDANKGLHQSPFNFKYRLYVRLDSGVERLVYDSVADSTFPASTVQDGFTSLENLRRTIDLALPDGVHNFKLEVEDRAGNISVDTLLDVTIDTELSALEDTVTIDLSAASDTGMSDRDDVTSIQRPNFTGVAEVGATVSIFANGLLVGTGVVGSDETDFVPGDGLGQWEVTVQPLDDGQYDVLAHIEDDAGNFLRTESLLIEVDTTQPNTPFLDLLDDNGHSDHDNITDVESPTFVMTTTDPDLPDGAGRMSDFNLKYRVYLRPEGGQETLLYNSVVDTNIDAANLLEGFTDLNRLQTILGPFPDGIHNLKLEVEDRAGNISEDFLLTFQLDSTLDGTPTIAMLQSSDTGMVRDDRVTRINQPAFTGVGEVGSTVRLLADGQLVGIAEIQSDLSDGIAGDGLGRWEVSSDVLHDGVYEFTAEIEDWAGNVETSNAVTVEIDTVAPNTPLLDLLNDTGHSDHDNFTASQVLEFNMTTEDPGEHANGFQLKYRLFARLEGGEETLVYDSSTDTSVAGQNGFTDLGQVIASLGPFPSGTHNFKLEVEDRAGNISDDFLLDVTVDSVPTAATLELLPSSDTGMFDDDRVTNLNAPAFSGLGEVGSAVRLFANGRLVGVGEVQSDSSDGVNADGRGLWEITSEPLDDGIYEFRAQVEDWAGNLANTSAVTLEIDTLAPNTPQLDLLPGDDSGLSDQDNVTSDPLPVFNMATIDPNSSNHISDFNLKYRLFVRLDSGGERLAYDSSTDTNFPGSVFEDGFTSLENLRRAIDLAVPDGVHNFKLEVEDRAGNISVDTLLDVTVDTVLDAPNAVIGIDLLAASDTGMSAEDNVTRQDRPIVTGVAEVGATVTILSGGRIVGVGVVGSDETDLNPGDGLGAWQVTVNPLDEGIHELTAHVEDLAGNFLRSETLAVEIDTRAPNTPYLDLVAESDTGLLGRDEVTSDNTLTFNMTTTDADAPDGHLIAENYKFRLYVRPENGSEMLVYDSVVDGELPSTAFRDGLIELEFLQRTLDALPDGTHNFKLEVEDRAGNISDDFLLNVTIDTSLTAPTIDLIDSSDTGMSSTDNVTNMGQPAFAGTGDVGDRVSLYANGVLVGVGFVGSDQTDFVPGDGRGAWEITSEPLDDGVYEVIAHVEDLAGTFERTTAITLEIDTLEPNTPHLDLVTSSDTGHSNHDNITRDATPTFTFTTEDPNADDHLSEFNLKYRLFLRPEGGEEVLVYNSVTDPRIDQANLQGGFTNLNFLETTLAALPDGIHNVKLEVEDRAGNLSHDVVLTIEIDSTLPDVGTIDLLDASDTGMSDEDNVTNEDEPAFSGVGTAGTLVRLFANGELVGSTEVGSDESDGVIGDGLGIWEITSEPLDDGVYSMVATFEDWAGLISASESLQIEVDTLQPNTPFLDLLESDDSGRHDDDRITNAAILRFSATTEDPNTGNHLQLFPGGENFKYRIFVRPEEGTEALVYDSVVDPSLPPKVDGFISLNQLTASVAGLPDGLHNFKLEVEDRAGNISEDFLANILIDRVGFQGTIALHPDSDTGIWGIASTFGDGITGDSTPTLTGTAEANNIVTLFVDGVMVGTTVAKPFDGDDAFTTATWEVTSSVLLSDGLHTVYATFEDPAGNQTQSVEIQLSVDTTGPRIENVTRADAEFTSIFDPKPAGGPDPLIDSIVVHFSDLPDRTAAVAYDAVLEPLALEEGNYRLVGDANGNIPIVSAQIVTSDDDGPGAARTAVRLNFAEPLPDDRFTLTVFDRIADAAGNPLDGDSGANGPFEGNDALTPTNPIFPTGDGNHGGNFLARFTIDSRPEIGVWAAGSVYVDTNGNFLFDPTNRDFVHRDITYTVGFASDDIFAGNFAGPDGVADGYDKLAAYGRYGGWTDGTFRWLVDLDNDGVVDIDVEDPADVNGLPVAGEFNGNAIDGDEVGLYTGRVWYFDTDGDYRVDLSLPSQLRGYPVVGDFDRDGHDDLGTWADDVFSIDLAGGVANGWDGVADVAFRFGFIGVRERPVAADMDQDGYDDLGLWVPDRGGMTPREAGEWYWLVSGGQSVLDRIVTSNDPVTRAAQEIQFRPTPFGDDIYAQFGDQFSIPIVGNFDPPTLAVETPVRSHTNHANPLDVTDDGAVSPRDVLAAVRYINQHGAAAVADLPSNLDLYLDTNNDGYFSPADILGIVSYLNDPPVGAAEPSDLDAIAADVAIASIMESHVDENDDEDEEEGTLIVR